MKKLIKEFRVGKTNELLLPLRFKEACWVAGLVLSERYYCYRSGTCFIPLKINVKILNLYFYTVSVINVKITGN